jgi:two-component system chemotaxis sensor kinase CheA
VSDSVRDDEFLAEAQEIIESLSRDLLLLDQAQKDAGGDPDLVNEVFRGVHTLKGIAGMFGYHQLGAVAHALEDLLDDLRLGRVALSQEVLDVLFEGVENFQRLLSDDESAMAGVSSRATRPASSACPARACAHARSALRVRHRPRRHGRAHGVRRAPPAHQPAAGAHALSPARALLARVHRHAARRPQARAKPVAEIITYLPSMDGGDGDHIELDVLLASGVSSAQLSEVLDARDDALRVVPRLRGKVVIDTPIPQGHPPTPIDGRIPNAPVPRELEGLAGLGEQRDARPRRHGRPAVAALGGQHGAGGHPQAGPPHERGGRAGHRAQLRGAPDRAHPRNPELRTWRSSCTA